MSKQNLISKAVRLAILCGAATGLASTAALAADQTAATDQNSTAQLGKIEVTGSRIKRTETETAQPVTMITSKEIQASGLTTIGAVIQKLTSTGASLSTLDNFGGNFTFTGGGESTVDLRNLDAKRVLVLVNGKRWVTALDGTVDLNTIPASVIDHVEVLQDGASAIYGSDAISGVVNIITVKNFNGRQADAYQGVYNGDGHWDGRTEAYDFTMGASDAKSGLVFNASYTNQDGILSKNRNISKEPVIGQGNSGGSSAIPNGRFVFVPPSTSPLAASCGGTCDLTFDTTTHSFRNFVSHGPTSDRFNYAPFNYVLTPEERYSGFLQGYTDLADNVTFKADMMVTHRDSHQQAAPEPLFFASSSIAIDIPSTQQYNPFGFALNAGDPSKTINLFLLGRRMVENGPRTYHEKEDVYHFDAGFTGFFNAGGSEWDWDANYGFSKDTEIDVNGGHFDVSHLRLALGDAAVCAQVAGCVQLNIFGGAGAVTRQMLDYIGYTAQNQFENDQRVYNVDMTNSDLAELPGGSMGVAFGAEVLEHDGFFQPDSVAQNGYDSFNPGRPVLPTKGSETSKAIYAETDLPLLGGMPGIKLLDLDLAGRNTRYNTFGSSNTYRWGLKWEPNNEWLVRTSWSQGFRAPTIQDLFSAGSNLSANIDDPCTTMNATTGAPHTPAAECAVQGISYVQPNQQINTLEIGNPHLKPETSISRTIGFVYSPDWLPGFNLNADYYRIDVNNTIQPASGQIILNGCYTTPAANSNAADCALVKRTVFHAVQTIDDLVQNVGSTETSGIDLSLSYAFPSTSTGDYKISFDDTHIKSFQQAYPNKTGLATIPELAGVERGGSVFPFGVPHDKIRTALDWSAGNWSAQYALRYVSHLVQPDGTHIGATTYHDVQGNYKADSIDTTFTVGIRNLFGKIPPSSTNQELNNFDPTLYDVPGRFVYGRVSVNF
ncbi:MAG TPA: TonB-dependent receptor [Gammaproteobacteria bacterium]|jgi:iron complex outermembrane receptor protein|nr:TonB-dependent receptor [Gammaproteobacteria bacterium]